MKYILGLACLIMLGCKPSISRIVNNKDVVKACQASCQEKFKTDIAFVGAFTGYCYCN